MVLRKRKKKLSIIELADKTIKKVFGSNGDYKKRERLLASIRAAKHFFDLRGGDKESTTELEHQIQNAILFVERNKK